MIITIEVVHGRYMRVNAYETPLSRVKGIWNALSMIITIERKALLRDRKARYLA